MIENSNLHAGGPNESRPNALTLINKLQNAVLDGRYSNISVLNRDPATGEMLRQMGTLSVVFSAEDSVTQQKVIIKFFDPDMSHDERDYRHPAFSREEKLLRSFRGRDRYLQLVSEQLAYLPISVSGSDEQSITLRCEYFVTEFVEHDVNGYFLGTQHSPRDRLVLFRKIALSVFALHREKIAHRDLKPDNLRLRRDGSLVVIDLGTARKSDDQPMGTGTMYSHPVGASAWAPLEANLGIHASGEFKLATTSDIHALGCLLYELFNARLYCSDRLDNARYATFEKRCRQHFMSNNPCSNELLQSWHKAVALYSRSVLPIRMGELGSDAPGGIVPILDGLVAGLTHVDYRRRVIDPNIIIRQIDMALRVIDNRALERKHRERKRLYRQNRRDNFLQNQERLEQLALERSQNDA